MSRLLPFIVFVLLAAPPSSAPDHAVEKRLPGRRSVPFLSHPQSRILSPDRHFLTSSAAHRKIHSGQVHPRRQHPQNRKSKSVFPDGSETRRLFPNCGSGHATPHPSTDRTLRVVVGSGEKAKPTYSGMEISSFSCPVSYWANLGWVNSPGYRDGFADSSAPSFPGAWSVTQPTSRPFLRQTTATAPPAFPWASSAKNVTAREGNT